MYFATIVDVLKQLRLRVPGSRSRRKQEEDEGRDVVVQQSACNSRRSQGLELRFFSLVHNANQLMRLPTQERIASVDDMRFIYAGMTTVIHSMACGIEFRAFAKIIRLRTDFYDKFTWFTLQPLFNFVGIEGFFCIS